MSERNPAIDRAIFAAGGKTALARALGISTQAIAQWPRVPSGRVLQVEAACGHKVTRHELRPDLYPAPAESAA